MNIRAVAPDEGDAIRRVATRSLEASYSLGPKTIEAAVDTWYDDEALQTAIEADDRLILVAERRSDDGVIAFSESRVAGGEADLMWLHVDPDYRDLGIGTALFEATRERLTARGADRLRGRVLTENVEGTAFYEAQGFERAGEETVEIDGEPHAEVIYVEPGSGGLEVIETADGERVYLDRDAGETGSRGPFYVAYNDPQRETRYGYVCGNCDSLATAMDAMGKVECSNCGNVRKATRWDAAYL